LPVWAEHVFNISLKEAGGGSRRKKEIWGNKGARTCAVGTI